MKEQLEKRLEELKKEFESGRQMLAGLEQKRDDLHATLLRISGAIQVLEEQTGPGENEADEPAAEHENSLVL